MDTSLADVGTNTAKLQEIAKVCVQLEIGCAAQWGNDDVTLMVLSEDSMRWVRFKEAFDTWASVSASSVIEAMTKLRARCEQMNEGGKTVLPKLDAVAVKIKYGPDAPNQLSAAELKYLVTCAWCETFKMNVPSKDELKTKLHELKQEALQFKLKIEQELKSGAKGKDILNRLTAQDRHIIKDWKDSNFSGCDLSNSKFFKLAYDKANFDNAQMTKSDLHQCSLKKASFKDANLEEADLTYASCAEADFSGASLRHAKLANSKLNKAKFDGAKLQGANLSNADLKGADFSKCDVSELVFVASYPAVFDETTIFAEGYSPSDNFKWTGKGPDPRLVMQLMSTSLARVDDFGGFLKGLSEHFDADRIKKALKMLKAERFELFSDVTSAHVVGVVRSQTDPQLVYSCHLANDGSFWCCTQNLNYCGGLRGSLCKHLLVLIIGLSKAGELDLASASSWVLASRLQKKPLLDKDLSSETFLRYKGAEAGEIDWRPTETLPEDYYAF